MIDEQYMDELAAMAMAKFPIPDEIHMVADMVGNRLPYEVFVRQRVFWMLEEAYNKGISDTVEKQGNNNANS
jgi:hypothetical protein